MTALKILTSSAMKIAESIAVEKGSSYMELMEQAGKGAADRILGLADVSGKQVVVLCGKGNNGGDGLVAAILGRSGRRNYRHLRHGTGTLCARPGKSL